VTARPVGDRALLVDTDDPHGLAVAIERAAPSGVEEVVVGAATVLVRHAAATDQRSLAAALAAIRPAAKVLTEGPHVVLDVVYDGPDLGEVAAAAGVSEAEVVARHTAATYTVAFCGFSPGFAYLAGLDPLLHVPRLASPRTRVPAGSVAVADRWTAAYPRESPGGWRLLGRTATPLWDLERDPPALLVPGTSVVLRAVRG
jgi:KipI family sensor histidine kinase inhibitor